MEQVTILVSENQVINVSDVMGSLKTSDVAPTSNGLYILEEVGTYTNLGGLITSAEKISYAYYNGTTWQLIERVLPINPFDLISDFIETQAGNYTYDRTTGLLTSTAAKILKLKKGNSLIINTVSNFNVVASGVTTGGQSILYVDFPTPSNLNSITTNLQVASASSIPNLATGYSRILLGISVNTSASVKDLIPMTGISLIENKSTNSDGFVQGNNDLVFNTTTGILSSSSLQTYLHNNGSIWYIADSAGAATFRISGFQAIPTTATVGQQYIIYSDVVVPKNSSTCILSTSAVNLLPAIAKGSERIIFGYGVKTGATTYEICLPLLKFYKETGTRISGIQKAIEFTEANSSGMSLDNKQKLETAWINPNPSILDSLPNFKKKFLEQQEDVEVLLLGDSLFALQSNASNVTAPSTGLPNGCYQNHIQYQLWDFLVKNKPMVNRWELTPNVFTRTGTWTIFGSGSGSKFDSPSWGGEFRSYVATIHQCSDANASIQFTWNLADYEKLNWVYKKSLDGTANVMIEITEGNGKAQVYNGTQWVEANGYVFSQKTTYQGSDSVSAGGSGFAVHLSDQKIKMRRVATTGTITLKFSKGTDSDYLYFWGTECWNGATIFITNVARAGRYLELLHNNFKNDVVERKPDLILFELPLINEYSNYSQVGYNTVVNHVHDYIFGDRSGNIKADAMKLQLPITTDVLFILPSWRQEYFSGNTPLKYKLSGASLNVITYDADSTPYATHQKVKALLDIKSVPYIDMANVFVGAGKRLGWTIEQCTTQEATQSKTSLNTFTYDKAHFNDFGSWVWAKYLGSLLTN